MRKLADDRVASRVNYPLLLIAYLRAVSWFWISKMHTQFGALRSFITHGPDWKSPVGKCGSVGISFATT
jgi:hypothetical protein